MKSLCLTRYVLSLSEYSVNEDNQVYVKSTLVCVWDEIVNG